MRYRKALLVAFGAYSLFPASACIWDTDTLAGEKARFPEIAELITGQFPRHSKEFHAWRLLLCQQQLDKGGEPIDYDDLAVSQHKLGFHRDAIETTKQKEQRFPGQYETLSNLGTFQIYTGELEAAAENIRKALAINSDAHFGREKYQLHFIEWLIDRSKLPPTPASDEELGDLPYGYAHGFARFLVRDLLQGDGEIPAEDVKSMGEEHARALRGLLGMMWFADFDNPLLLEALGDLLIAGDHWTNASQLASMSYLHASQRTPDASEKARLRSLAEAAIALTAPRGVGVPETMDISEIEDLLKTGLATGAAYSESIRQDEVEWIKAGADARIEFQKKYLTP